MTKQILFSDKNKRSGVTTRTGTVQYDTIVEFVSSASAYIHDFRLMYESRVRFITIVLNVLAKH